MDMKKCERCGKAERVSRERFCVSCKKCVKAEIARDPRNAEPIIRHAEQLDRPSLPWVSFDDVRDDEEIDDET